jgi:hypothetical protein
MVGKKKSHSGSETEDIKAVSCSALRQEPVGQCDNIEAGGV